MKRSHSLIVYACLLVLVACFKAGGIESLCHSFGHAMHAWTHPVQEATR